MAKFSKTKILDLRAKAEQYWRDSQAVTNQIPITINSVKAILANQTAKFQELTGPNKKRKLSISFLTNCGATTSDITASCDIDGTELDSDTREYDFNLGQQTTFKVESDLERWNEYSSDEVIAKGLHDAKLLLDNWIAKTTLAMLDTYKGVNKYPDPFTWDATDSTTFIPEGKYSEKMVANLIQQAELNDIHTPYFISDGKLFVDYLNAEFDSPNAEGKGDFRRSRALNLHFDQKNFALSGVKDNIYMVDKSAVALATKAWHSRVPVDLGDKITYSVKSDYLPGVEYDVDYQFKCVVVDDEEKYFHHFRLRTYGIFAQNPIACNNTTTGVLGYQAKAEEVTPPEVEG